MTKEVFRIDGLEELNQTFTELQNDFGSKDSKRIITRGIRHALQPTLVAAKAEVAKDTGALAASLQVEARRVTSKDRGSKYVEQQDDFIGAVTTASGKKLASVKFVNLRSQEIYKPTKGKGAAIKQVGVKSDARAAALEFGTAKMGARPFLRSALESTRQEVVDSLGESIRMALEQYKTRAAKRAAKGK